MAVLLQVPVHHGVGLVRREYKGRGGVLRGGTRQAPYQLSSVDDAASSVVAILPAAASCCSSSTIVSTAAVHVVAAAVAEAKRVAASHAVKGAADIIEDGVMTVAVEVVGHGTSWQAATVQPESRSSVTVVVVLEEMFTLVSEGVAARLRV